MTLHVGQVQETQPEPPGFAGIRQSDQQISDFFVLGTSLGAIATTDNARQASAMLAPRRTTAVSAISRR
jgi:hypothetical protein